MAMKEIRLSMNDPRLKDPNQISKFVAEQMEEANRSIMMNDVTEIIDDFDTGERVLKIKENPKRVFLGR